MRMDDVQRLFADGLGKPLGAASGVLIRGAPERLEWIKQRLDRIPAVAAVHDRGQTYDEIQELMRFNKVFMGILAFFGIGLAFAAVFTAVSINVLERVRELATLRTLGFGLRQIAWFTSVENLAVAAAGAAIGVPLGRWLDVYLITSAETESMSLEPVIYLQTYLIAVFGILALALVSQIPSLINVRRMDLAQATKHIAD
jgi:putative ABC transport system permease protein